jgi:hypothetical protein
MAEAHQCPVCPLLGSGSLVRLYEEAYLETIDSDQMVYGEDRLLLHLQNGCLEVIVLTSARCDAPTVEAYDM